MGALQQALASLATSGGGGGGGAVAFDAQSSTTSTGNGVVTFSHTCTGSDRFLVVGIVCSMGMDVTGITYNGVALTEIGANVDNNDSFADLRISAWRLIAPATGANNIAASFSGAPADRVLLATSYTNVHQTTPLGTEVTAALNNVTSHPITGIGGATDDMMWSLIATSGDAGGLTSDGTDRVTATLSNSGRMATKPGAGSVSFTWTSVNSRWSVLKGIAIKHV